MQNLHSYYLATETSFDFHGWEYIIYSIINYKLQLIMIQELMKDWIMDPEVKKFGGGKRLLH